MLENGKERSSRFNYPSLRIKPTDDGEVPQNFSNRAIYRHLSCPLSFPFSLCYPSDEQQSASYSELDCGLDRSEQLLRNSQRRWWHCQTDQRNWSWCFDLSLKILSIALSYETLAPRIIALFQAVMRVISDCYTNEDRTALGNLCTRNYLSHISDTFYEIIVHLAHMLWVKSVQVIVKRVNKTCWKKWTYYSYHFVLILIFLFKNFVMHLYLKSLIHIYSYMLLLSTPFPTHVEWTVMNIFITL